MGTARSWGFAHWCVAALFASLSSLWFPRTGSPIRLMPLAMGHCDSFVECCCVQELENEAGAGDQGPSGCEEALLLPDCSV